jgi:hypothetical protein
MEQYEGSFVADATVESDVRPKSGAGIGCDLTPNKPAFLGLWRSALLAHSTF